jgi:hypothetical protein
MNAVKPKVGDILLMMSTDELSKLIAWFGDSAYSHSALMVADDLLMESIAQGICETQLEDLMRPDFNIKYVDVFRSLDREGNLFNDSQQIAIRASAHKFIDIPFEFGKLIQIGVLAAVRQKTPANPMVRRLLRLAFDHVLANSDKAMTCSQFVYTSLLRADVAPSACITPRIVYSGSSGLPFPDNIDWLELAKEIKALLPGHEQLENANWLNEEIMDDEISLLSDAALQQKAAAVRLALGITATDEMQIATHDVGDIIDNPNPKLVTPGDLFATPDHIAQGRWFSM